MRNLTLGLIIVAGGTLAALPFRRTAPIEELTPSSSPIEPALLTNPSFPAPVGMLVDHAEPQAEWIDRIVPEPRTQPPQWPLRRELSAPLTYDDLAMPITLPEKIEKRFTATESVRKAGKNKKATAFVPFPGAQAKKRNDKTAGLASQGKEQSVLVTEPADQTTLASTPLGESTIERLPKKSTSTQKRFWIRQP